MTRQILATLRHPARLGIVLAAAMGLMVASLLSVFRCKRTCVI